jgi:hypothetical protein
MPARELYVIGTAFRVVTYDSNTVAQTNNPHLYHDIPKTLFSALEKDGQTNPYSASVGFAGDSCSRSALVPDNV